MVALMTPTADGSWRDLCAPCLDYAGSATLACLFTHMCLRRKLILNPSEEVWIWVTQISNLVLLRSWVAKIQKMNF